MSERTIILDAIIRVLMLVVTAVLLPALKSWIERNRDNREVQLLLQLANVAVRSVQDDLKTDEGQKKRAEAIERLTLLVAQKGLKGFSTDELEHYIRTAYTEMIDNKLFELPLLEVSDLGDCEQDTGTQLAFNGID